MTTSSAHGPWTGPLVLMGLAMILFSGHFSGPDLVSAGAQKASSAKLRRFASVISGKFSNEEQVNKETSDGQQPDTVINAVFHPVNMSKIKSDFTFYFERIVDAQVTLRLIRILTKGNNGSIIMKSYELNEASSSSSPSSSSPDLSIYESLALKDLMYSDYCDATFYETAKAQFVGFFWPDCELYPSEQVVITSAVITCDSMVFLPMNDFTPERPLVFKSTERFPLLGDPSDKKSRNICIKAPKATEENTSA